MILTHETAAGLLFACGQTVPSSTFAAVQLINRQYRRDPDVSHASAILAEQYGADQRTAAARMTRCLEVTPTLVDVPDVVTPAAMRLLGCDTDDCASDEPLELVGRRLYCPDHLAEALTTIHDGGDDDDDY
jgi:hypothetical protein